MTSTPDLDLQSINSDSYSFNCSDSSENGTRASESDDLSLTSVSQ